MGRRSKEEKTAKENAAQEKKSVISDLKVLRATEFEDNLFFDMEVNGVTIYGCRYVEGKNGDFIAFPSKKGKDGKYYKHAYVELDEAMVSLIDEQLDGLL